MRLETGAQGGPAFVLRFDSATPAGEPRSTRVYARVRGAEEPMGPKV